MEGRNLLELSEHKTHEWTDEELHRHHRVLSDVSPWLNAQGNAIHHQIIGEIERRGGVKGPGDSELGTFGVL